jgi:uncharacterized protein (TIGR03000 family)
MHHGSANFHHGGSNFNHHHAFYPGFYGAFYGGFPYYPRYYGYGYGYGGYGDYYPYGYDSYPPVDTYQSFYPPAPQAIPQPMPPADAPVTIAVHVPPGAAVWFQGVRTNGSGAWREYRSPPLQSGYDYQYEIRSEWNDNGRPVSQVRQVTVRPGQRVTVDFMAPVQTSAVP